MCDKIIKSIRNIEGVNFCHLITCGENKNIYQNHQEYEFLVLLSDSARFQIEGSCYDMKNGDIALLSRRELHRIEYDTSKPYERIVVHFNKKILLPYINSKSNLLNAFDGRPVGTNNIIDADVAKKYNIINIIEQIKNENSSQKTGKDIVSECLFIMLLVELNRAHENMQKNGRFSQSDRKILQIIDYINKNLDSDLTLESISKKFFISKYHLAHTFKKETGFSVNRYITYKRVAYAEKLISDGYSAREASFGAGFNDYSNFYKAFVNQTGNSPKIYKKK